MDITTFLRKNTLSVFIVCLGTFAFAACSEEIATKEAKKHEPKDSIRNGDIVFQESLSTLSKAIQLATRSEYSHVGIVFEDKGEWMVYEAIQPVSITKFDEWTKRGKDSQYKLMRLENADSLLTESVLEKMKSYATQQVGKNYDSVFGWSDDQFYCSELVWKVYAEGAEIRLTAPRPLKEYDLSHPLVKNEMKLRYGDNIPLEEPMVSPGDLFKSDKLLAAPVSK